MAESWPSWRRTDPQDEPHVLSRGKPVLVSVVIPAYNAEETIGAQLEALGRQDYEGPWELIIADNSSTDRTRDVVASFDEQFPRLRVVDASERRGPAHARNAGAAAAEGDLLLFCDADDVVSRSWIRAMAQASLSDDLLGGVGALTRMPDTAVLPCAPPHPTQFPFLPWVKAANLGVRRELFEAAGRFDETRLTGEDVDLCWRIQLQGVPLRFVADAHISYRERDSLRDAVARTYGFGSAAHELYLVYKDRGAPHPGLRWALRGSLRLLGRAPMLLLGADSRRRWLTRASGVAGRLSAVIRNTLRKRQAGKGQGSR